ncbi:hypothetical protein HYFRA_00005189 [Hymenoscyphus fraxineus]|uniref:Uncharacterized protein n=1 Tax=Hymenoscyphus fraxineus TaxID=746836 RepID=A0A9N9L9Y1_9HELO|nr:hypothetical protein HYFRA_00005189 [Hymenoscyphus fraxineus]
MKFFAIFIATAAFFTLGLADNRCAKASHVCVGLGSPKNCFESVSFLMNSSSSFVNMLYEDAFNHLIIFTWM